MSGAIGRASYLAEAAVIVLSILLAFGIDATWDARNAAADEAALLEAIRADMVTNREALDRFIGVMDVRFDRTARFIESTPDALAELEPDSAVAFLRTFLSSGFYTPSDGALRSSTLSTLGDLELRTELGSWLRFAENVSEDQPILETGAREVATKSGVAGAPRVLRGPAFFPQLGTAASVLAQLRREPEFIDSFLIQDTKLRRNADKLRLLRGSTTAVLDLIAEIQR